MSTLETAWNLVFAGSLRASALIAAVLLLRWLAQRWLPTQCFHLLWLLVAVKLLVPVGPSASWSAFNLPHWVTEPRTRAIEPAWRVTLASVTTEARASVPPPLPATRAIPLEAKAPKRWAHWVPLLWLAGVVIQCGQLGRAMWRMRTSLRHAATAVDTRMIELADECAAQLALPRVPRILETDAVAGPAVVGVLRPRLLLPRGLAAGLCDEELRCVLLHEFAHMRRRDLVGLWLVTVARTIHWFNPLVWIAVRCSRLDTEFACDATVLRSRGATACESYGAALLRVAQTSSWRPTALPAAGIVESKRALGERLRRIALFRPASRLRMAASAAIVVAAGLAFGANETAPAPPADSVSIALMPPAAAPATFPEAGFAEAWANFVKTVPFNTSLAPARDFARGWTVAALSLSQRTERPVLYVRIRRLDGEEFALFSTGASHGGVVLDRVDWQNASRPRVVLRNGKTEATLDFPASSTAVAGPRKFAEGWKIAGVSQPAPGNEGGIEVDVETDYGATMSLVAGRRVKTGFWAEVTGPDDATQPLTVTLHHGAEHAEFRVERSLVVERAHDPSATPQIEIEGRFIEIKKDALAKIKEPELQWLKPARKPGRETALNAVFGEQQNASGNLSGVFTPEEREGVTRALNGQRGVEVLSTPKVTTKSGQRAVIEIIRELRYPTDWELDKTGRKLWTPTKFETKNCGVTLEVEAKLGPDGKTIDLSLTPQVIDFLGFVDLVTRKAIALPKAREKTKPGTPPVNLTDIAPGLRLVPIFSERTVSANVSIFEGQTVAFGAVHETADTKPFKSVEADRQLVVLVTARRIDHRGLPFLAEASSSISSNQSKPDAPAAALPVPEKPGFVRSPYAPDADLIDVRGFPPGTEVKCPHSGKIFQLP